MGYTFSSMAKEVLNKERTYPIEVLSESPESAEEIALLMSMFRALTAGIPIKSWPTKEVDSDGNLVMHSVHVEGYGAPIHVYVKDDCSRDLRLETYGLWDAMRDSYALGMLRQSLGK